MKKIVSFALIFFIFKVIAQPNFTSADMIKLSGEVYSDYNIDTTGISEGPSGPNQNWNFNIITLGNASVSNVTAASISPFNTYFPSADIVITYWQCANRTWNI
jgi:hypothetical protein